MKITIMKNKLLKSRLVKDKNYTKNFCALMLRKASQKYFKSSNKTSVIGNGKLWETSFDFLIILSQMKTGERKNIFHW